MKQDNFDKGAWAAKKKAERQRVFAMVEQATQQLSDPAKLWEYLTIQQRFDRYTVSNALLVAAQCPTATRLADYETWAQRGVSVRRGAQSISILEPGKSYNWADGSVGRSFNIKHLFDIGQTNAPQTSPAKPDPKTLARAIVSSSPVRVRAVDSPGDFVARYDPAEKELRVARHRTPQQLCTGVLAAIVEARMDTELHDPPADPQANRDLALFMLCQRYGLPMQKPELSDRQKALDAKALRGELETVRRLTSGCMAAVEKQLAHLRQAEKGDHDER